MKAILRKICPKFIHSCYASVKFFIRYHVHPEGIADEMHTSLVGYHINWKNPQTLNERINWMKFNYDTSIWTRLADKFLVREYVKERVGEQILPKLYSVWKTAEEMDFHKLPNKFILKTNHGCHTVFPVMDKSSIDTDMIKKKFSVWISKKYG